MRDGGHGAPGQGADRVIHLGEHIAIDVEQIPRNLKSQNLPAPLPQQLVSAAKALEKNRREGRGTAIFDDICTGVDSPPRANDLYESSFFFVRQATQCIQLFY